MSSFDQSPFPSGPGSHPGYRPDPAATSATPPPNYGPTGFPGMPDGGAAVTQTEARSGRGRFLGFVAAAVLAAGTGLAGFTAAGGMIGGDDGARTELSSAGDQGASDGSDGGGAATNDQDGDRSTGEAESTDGSGATDGPDPVERSTPVPGAAMTVEQANASVIRIEATGEFADPEFGTIEGVGSGSGFIIEETGIAVTNNHVVAGAAFIEVFVPGEDRPRNARILATSECSDLAVIDIEGDGFPIVTMNMVSPVVGTDVYAAGYPLGDPEFTLTKGIVSRADTRGDTHLSSVDGVLEHDARINPGNSGGPLFDHFGQVVGVNYQGNRSTNQSFAITAADAIGIIDQLSAGNSVDSIGVNGQIVNLGDRFGLFISSVETGSMADRVGLVAGDVILELENVAVSTDGTMGAYCDVLRTNGTDVALDITVLRPATGQLLFGTLNDEQLAVGFDGGEMMSGGSMSDGSGQTSPAVDTSGYQELTDDRGVVSVQVPAAWTDIRTSALGSQNDLPNVSASTDLDSFENEWVLGGIQLTAFDAGDYDYDEIWMTRNQLMEQCGTVEAAENVDLGAYSGVLRVGHQCGPEAIASLVLFQVDGASGSHFASGIIQVVTEADIAAVERALTTFDIR